jgi:hypothetical protein
MRKFNKVFGIGISRTGTTSLTSALELLGIPTVHWPSSMRDFELFRGATDVTVACRFKELDLIFPHSLFIYTERDSESWLRSVIAHYNQVANAAVLRDATEAFQLEADIRIYGRLNPLDLEFPGAYRRHHEQVMQYFHDKEDRLLRMNIERGDGWQKLCSFFQVPEPAVPFPHLNKKNMSIGTPRVMASLRNIDARTRTAQWGHAHESGTRVESLI